MIGVGRVLTVGTGGGSGYDAVAELGLGQSVLVVCWHYDLVMVVIAGEC